MAQDVEYRVSQKGAEKVASQLGNIQKGMSRTAITASGQLTPSLRTSNATLLSTSRIVQDMPFGFMGVGNNITFMAEQMAHAKTQGIGLKAQLKGMLGALAGPGGMIFAISAVTSVITIMTMQMGKGGNAVKDFAAELKELWSETFRTEEAWRKFNEEIRKFTDSQITESIRTLKEELDNLMPALWEMVLIGLGKTGDALSSQVDDIVDNVKRLSALEGLNKSGLGLIEQLKNDIKILETKREQADTVAQIDFLSENINQKQDKLNELLGKTKNTTSSIKANIEGISKGLDKMLTAGDPSKVGQAGQGGLTSFGDATRTMTIGNASLSGFSSGYKETMDMIRELTFTATDVLRDEFRSAWEDIFGEANSLFEKLMLSWAETISSMFLQKAGSSIIDYLIGGALGFLGGGPGGAVAGVAGAALGSKPITIINQIGEEELGRTVLRGNQIIAQRRLT